MRRTPGSGPGCRRPPPRGPGRWWPGRRRTSPARTGPGPRRPGSRTGRRGPVGGRRRRARHRWPARTRPPRQGAHPVGTALVHPVWPGPVGSVTAFAPRGTITAPVSGDRPGGRSVVQEERAGPRPGSHRVRAGRSTQGRPRRIGTGLDHQRPEKRQTRWVGSAAGSTAAGRGQAWSTAATMTASTTGSGAGRGASPGGVGGAHRGTFPCLRRGSSSRLEARMSQAPDQDPAGVGRVDHVVDVAALGRHVGVGVALGVLLDQLGPPGRGVVGLGQLAAVDDLDRPLGTHDRQLGRRPGEGQVGADGLGVHDHVGAAVGLAGDDLDPRHRRLAVGVEQLGPVADDAAVLLVGAGHEPGHVDEGDQRDVEGVAGAHEAGRLLRRVDVEHAGQDRRLVAHDADDPAVDAGEAAGDRHGPVGVDLEVVAVVDHRGDDLLHVVGLVGRGRHQVDQLGRARGRGRRPCTDRRRLLQVVGGEERRAGSARRPGTPSRRATRRWPRRTWWRGSWPRPAPRGSRPRR